MKIIHQECIIILDRIGQLQQEIANMENYQNEWGSFWGFSDIEANKEITEKEKELEDYKTQYNLLLLKLTK